MTNAKFAPARVVSTLGLSLLFSAALLAADKPEAEKPSSDSPLAAYPLKTCVVSGEKLGSMGKPIAYVHHEAGKPDRTVYLCCETCLDDFKESPAKFLAKLDAAAKAPAKK
jgi:hypothetical protein